MPLSRPNKRIKAVLFDLDDTLLDWSKRDGEWQDISRYHINKVYDYLTTTGHLLPDKESFCQLYLETVSLSWNEAKKNWAGVGFANVLTDTFAGLGLDTSQIDLYEVMLAYDWRPMPGVVPFEDAIPVLESLREMGYKIGLITNSMVPMWMRDIELRAYELIDYFDARITSGDTGYMKPHPAIYHRALNLLDTTVEQAVFVGDRPANDIAGANETGLISILMAPAHLDRDVNGIKPDYTISCLGELLSILEILE